MRSGLRAAILRHRGTFQPTDLGSALKGWWSADDLSAASVSTWTDRISGIAATATSTAIPTWGATGWTTNSKPGVTFDGAANCLVSTSFAALPQGSTAGEMWALVNIDAAAASLAVAAYGGATTNRRNIGVSPVSGTRRALVTDGTTAITDTVTNMAGAHIVGGYWNGTTEGMRIDGADANPATGTITTINTSSTRLRIGASSGTSAATFLTGKLRHLMITTSLTDAQRLQLEGWLAWDGWSNASSNTLPATHPYKNAPP